MSAVDFRKVRGVSKFDREINGYVIHGQRPEDLFVLRGIQRGFSLNAPEVVIFAAQPAAPIICQSVEGQSRIFLTGKCVGKEHPVPKCVRNVIIGEEEGSPPGFF